MRKELLLAFVLTFFLFFGITINIAHGAVESINPIYSTGVVISPDCPDCRVRVSSCNYGAHGNFFVSTENKSICQSYMIRAKTLYKFYLEAEGEEGSFTWSFRLGEGNFTSSSLVFTLVEDYDENTVTWNTRPNKIAVLGTILPSQGSQTLVIDANVLKQYINPRRKFSVLIEFEPDGNVSYIGTNFKFNFEPLIPPLPSYQYDWTKEYYISGNDIVFDLDGGDERYVLVGTNTTRNGNFILTLDKNGNEIHQLKDILGNSPLYQVKYKHPDTIWVAGKNTANQLVVAKLNIFGDISWNRTYTDISMGSSRVYGIEIDKNENVWILAGSGGSTGYAKKVRGGDGYPICGVSFTAWSTNEEDWMAMDYDDVFDVIWIYSHWDNSAERLHAHKVDSACHLFTGPWYLVGVNRISDVAVGINSTYFVGSRIEDKDILIGRYNFTGHHVKHLRLSLADAPDLEEWLKGIYFDKENSIIYASGWIGWNETHSRLFLINFTFNLDPTYSRTTFSPPVRTNQTTPLALDAEGRIYVGGYSPYYNATFTRWSPVGLPPPPPPLMSNILWYDTFSRYTLEPWVSYGTGVYLDTTYEEVVFNATDDWGGLYRYVPPEVEVKDFYYRVDWFYETGSGMFTTTLYDKNNTEIEVRIIPDTPKILVINAGYKLFEAEPIPVALGKWNRLIIEKIDDSINVTYGRLDTGDFSSFVGTLVEFGYANKVDHYFASYGTMKIKLDDSILKAHCFNILSSGTYVLDPYYLGLGDIVTTTGKDCIEIKADNVVLDLNNYKIWGCGHENRTKCGTGDGIRAESKANITIKNGEIVGFGGHNINFRDVVSGNVTNMTITIGNFLCFDCVKTNISSIIFSTGDFSLYFDGHSHDSIIGDSGFWNPYGMMIFETLTHDNILCHIFYGRHPYKADYGTNNVYQDVCPWGYVEPPVAPFCGNMTGWYCVENYEYYLDEWCMAHNKAYCIYGCNATTSRCNPTPSEHVIRPEVPVNTTPLVPEAGVFFSPFFLMSMLLFGVAGAVGYGTKSGLAFVVTLLLLIITLTFLGYFPVWIMFIFILIAGAVFAYIIIKSIGGK